MLDPFAGSGSTGVAALELDRRFMGIEVNEQFIRIGMQRLAAASSTPSLPRFFEVLTSANGGELSMDRRTALEKLQRLVGQDLRKLADDLGVTVWRNGKLNKGWAGHTVERYLGLPPNFAQSPDLGSWELKVVPITVESNGGHSVKESMALTMLDPKEVAEKSFEESRLFTKLRKIIAVARVREHDAETHSVCKLAHAFDLEETALYDEVARDYRQIQQVIKTKGVSALTGRIGKYVQPRTKGAGHGSTSRAFYARKVLVEYIGGLRESPRMTERLAECFEHADHANSRNRERLDARMAHLPANQSEVGR